MANSIEISAISIRGETPSITISLPKLLVGLTFTSIIFANVPLPILGIEDSYALLLFPGWLVVAFIYFAGVRRAVPGLRYFGVFVGILFFSSLLGLFKVNLEGVAMAGWVKNTFVTVFPKLLFLVVTVICVRRLCESQILSLYRAYAALFLTSCLVAAACVPFASDRFIIYEEEAGLRFAAFHYELANFVYSGVLSLIILSRRFGLIRKFGIIFLIGIPLLILVSLSNFLPPLAFAIFLGMILLCIRWKHLRAIAFTTAFLLGFCAIVLLGRLGEVFEALIFLFPRGGSEFSLEGSALFVRLFPMIKSAEFFVNNFFSLPYGLSNAQLDVSLQDPLYQIAAGGLTKICADLVWLIVPLFLVAMVAMWKLVKRIDVRNVNDQTVFLIFVASLFYICFQPGFFNFTAWSAIILSFRYVKMI